MAAEYVVNEEYCSQGWRGDPIDHPAIDYTGGELNVTTPSRGDLRSSAPVVFRPLVRELTARNFEAYASCVLNGLPSPGGVVILDPTGLDFIDLYAIAGLYHLALSLREESGCQVALDLSAGPACGYMVRVALPALLPEGIVSPEGSEATAERYRGNNIGLLEFTPVRATTDTGQIASRMYDALMLRLNLTARQAGEISSVLHELCANMPDHGGPGAEGMVAMQAFWGRNGPYAQVYVGDRGEGIRESLSRNPKHRDLASDVDAIKRSLGRRVSRHLERTRGQGLYHTMRLVEEHRGSLFIRSGAGWLHRRPDIGVSEAYRVRDMRGTQIFLNFDGGQQ